jgi:hypothetical protein
MRVRGRAFHDHDQVFVAGNLYHGWLNEQLESLSDRYTHLSQQVGLPVDLLAGESGPHDLELLHQVVFYVKYSSRDARVPAERAVYEAHRSLQRLSKLDQAI